MNRKIRGGASSFGRGADNDLDPSSLSLTICFGELLGRTPILPLDPPLSHVLSHKDSVAPTPLAPAAFPGNPRCGFERFATLGRSRSRRMSDALINPDLSSTWPVWEGFRWSSTPETEKRGFFASDYASHFPMPACDHRSITATGLQLAGLLHHFSPVLVGCGWRYVQKHVRSVRVRCSLRMMSTHVHCIALSLSLA